MSYNFNFAEGLAFRISTGFFEGMAPRLICDSRCFSFVELRQNRGILGLGLHVSLSKIEPQLKRNTLEKAKRVRSLSWLSNNDFCLPQDTLDSRGLRGWQASGAVLQCPARMPDCSRRGLESGWVYVLEGRHCRTEVTLFQGCHS